MKLHVPLGQFLKLITQCDLIRKRRVCRTVNVTCLKSRVGLRQTAHSWANAGIVLGARVRRRVAFETIKLIDAKVGFTYYN